MAQVQVDAPVWGMHPVYAGKSPDSDTNPWPANILAVNDMATATTAVVAIGAAYPAAYVACLNKNDMLFALRTAAGPAGLFPIGS